MENWNSASKRNPNFQFGDLALQFVHKICAINPFHVRDNTLVIVKEAAFRERIMIII